MHPVFDRHAYNPAFARIGPAAQILREVAPVLFDGWDIGSVGALAAEAAGYSVG